MGHFSLQCNRYVVICATLFAGAVTPTMAQVAAPSAPAQSAVQRPAVAPMRLQPLVDRLVQEAGFSATVCIYVESAGGTVLADRHGKTPLAPASNNKLVTTAAGMTLLSPTYTFDTRFFANGPVKDGVLQGDLIVYGGGDPAISGRYLADKKDVKGVLRQWAKKLKAMGINTINGNIVADDSFFDDVYFHPNWYPSERGEWYEAEVSALAFNDNCIDITWSGKGKLPDEAANYTLNPKTDYVQFDSSVKTVAKGRSTERYYKRGATDNHIKATGTINVESTDLDSAAIHDGALYCVNVFADVLKKQGIQVKGRPTKIRGAAAKLPAGSELFVYESEPLLKVCQTINLNSQNFYAECLAKTLGKEKAGRGTFDAGTQVIENFCRSQGIYSAGHNAVDGSGLAGENRVTGKQLVDVLRYMDTHGLKEQWRSTLPRGHDRGSLKNRFDDASDDVAKRIFGKTGLIGGVRSLSGFVVDANGQELYYSIILNDLKDKDAPKAMKLIDKTAVELAKSGK